MTLLERIKSLCVEKNISQRKLEKELNLGNGASSKWSKSSPSGEVLYKISEYFNVSVDWLLGKTEVRATPGNEPLNYEGLTEKDRKDIAKKMDAMLYQLDDQDGLMFDGEILDDETRELLKNSLENSLKMGKVIAKQKFTPKKNNK